MYDFLGVLPIVGNLKCGDKDLESLESLKDYVCENDTIEIAIDGMSNLILLYLFLRFGCDF